MSELKPPARTWVEINPGAIRHNAELILQKVSPAGILPVVKANAYGHGAVEVAGCLSGLSGYFAVANLEEAIQLKEAGIRESLVLLGPSLPGERQPSIKSGFLPTVSSAKETRAFPAGPDGCRRVHFKIDSGMGRIGAWKDDALSDLLTLATDPACKVEMISTHLPSVEEDPRGTEEQLLWFQIAREQLLPHFPAAKFHALNSAGILRFPDRHFDLVRPGLLLYGVSPVSGNADGEFLPALSWRARVALVRNVPAGRSISYGGEFVTKKPCRLAVLPIGYADGFFRQIPSETAHVLLRGQRCKVVGRVTMDQVVVDVTHLPGLEEGEVATIIGKDQEAEIRAQEYAGWAGTISWHALTAIGPRVQRVFW